MRTLVRPGRKSALVRVEERGLTSFVLAGLDEGEEVFLDPTDAIASFQEVERGDPHRHGRTRHALLNLISRRFLASSPARA